LLLPSRAQVRGGKSIEPDLLLLCLIDIHLSQESFGFSLPTFSDNEQQQRLLTNQSHIEQIFACSGCSGGSGRNFFMPDARSVIPATMAYGIHYTKRPGSLFVGRFCRKF
jgi:hypothetical protein